MYQSTTLQRQTRWYCHYCVYSKLSLGVMGVGREILVSIPHIWWFHSAPLRVYLEPQISSTDARASGRVQSGLIAAFWPPIPSPRIEKPPRFDLYSLCAIVKEWIKLSHSLDPFPIPHQIWPNLPYQMPFHTCLSVRRQPCKALFRHFLIERSHAA